MFLTVYSYTELMDQKKYSLAWESARVVFGLAIINYYGDWFGLNVFLSFGNVLVVGYLVLSWLVNVYFVVVVFGAKRKG